MLVCHSLSLKHWCLSLSLSLWGYMENASYWNTLCKCRLLTSENHCSAARLMWLWCCVLLLMISLGAQKMKKKKNSLKHEIVCMWEREREREKLCGQGNLFMFWSFVKSLTPNALISRMALQVKKVKRKAEESPWAFNPFQKYQNHKNEDKNKVKFGSCVL